MGNSSVPMDSFYKNSNSQNVEFPKNVDEIFQQINFKNIKLNASKFNKTMGFKWLHRIYYTNFGFSSKGYIFSRSNLDVSNNIVMGKLYSANDSHILHFKTEDSKVIAFYFTNVEKGSLNFISKKLAYRFNTQLITEHTSWQKFLKIVKSINFGINVAYAETGKNYFCTTEEPDPQYAKRLRAALKSGKNCVKEVAKGAWDVTGGSAMNIAQSTTNVVLHPIKTFESAKESLDTYRKLFANFNESLGEFKDDVKALSNDEFTELFCRTGSNITFGALVAGLTKGMSGARILSVTAKNLRAMAKLKKSKKLRDLSDRMLLKAQLLSDNKKRFSASGKKLSSKIVSEIKKDNKKLRKKLKELNEKLEELEKKDVNIALSKANQELEETLKLIKKLKTNPVSFKDTELRQIISKAINLHTELEIPKTTKQALSENAIQLERLRSVYKQSKKSSSMTMLEKEIAKKLNTTESLITSIKDGGLKIPGVTAVEKEIIEKQIDQVKKQMVTTNNTIFENESKMHIVNAEMDAVVSTKPTKIAISSAAAGVASCNAIENTDKSLSRSRSRLEQIQGVR